MLKLSAYSKYLSLLCFLIILASCFMPWAYYADINETFNGFYSHNNVYGKPAKLLLSFAGFVTIAAFIKKLIFKRAALLIGGLTVAYAIKNFLLFGSCYRGYCPEKHIGLYLMLIASIVIFLTTFFQEGKSSQE